MNQPTVFISYSHKDEDWKDRVTTHLRVLQKEGLFDLWDDRRIQAGENWHQEINDAMNAACAAMLLITADFLTSAFILNKEVPRLLERREREGLSIFPVIVKPCAWKRVKWLSQMQLRPKDGKPLSSGDENQIDTYLSSIAEEVAEIMEKSKVSPAHKPLDPRKLKPIWNVSQRRNPNFTGREEVLSKLADDLNSGHQAALTQTITGLGGIGKTQIALEYTYRSRPGYEAIWWLRAEEADTLAADYASFARAANLPEKDAQEEHIIIDAVRRWLEQNEKWLFIFDNAQKPNDIHDYLPREPTGHILITSRHQAWGKLGSSISIDNWPRSESVDFLFKRTKCRDRPSAEKVAEKLGDMPLALEQAAAYVNETRIGLSDYMELFQTRRNKLWNKEHPPLDYSNTVSTTWSLAIEKIQEKEPIGVLILNFCSYFAADDIPRSLMSDVSEYLPEDLSPLFSDPLTINAGIGALNHYSLINAQPDSLSIHRLVQAVVRDRLSIEDQKLWAEVAVRAVNTVFPAEGYNNPKFWPKCAVLLSHGRVVIDHSVEKGVALEEVSHLLDKIASYLHGRAAYAEAEPLYRQALEVRETQLGAEHPDVASSLNNLA